MSNADMAGGNGCGGEPPVDPITREIIQNALASAADEMALALYRTAYSTIVRDCLDYSTSLCNAQGEMIAQGVTTPLHLGTVPYAMETLFRKYGESMRPGDVFILNDPFDGGMHIPDIFIVKPIFWEDCLAAFRREHGSPPRPGGTPPRQLGLRQHRNLSGRPADSLVEALPGRRARRGSLRPAQNQRPGCRA